MTLKGGEEGAAPEAVGKGDVKDGHGKAHTMRNRGKAHTMIDNGPGGSTELHPLSKTRWSNITM